MKFTDAIKCTAIICTPLRSLSSIARSSQTKNTRVLKRGLKSPWSELSDPTEERGTIPASRKIHCSIMARSFKQNWADKETGRKLQQLSYG